MATVNPIKGLLIQDLARTSYGTSSDSVMAYMVSRDLQQVTAKAGELLLCMHDLQDEVQKDNAQVCSQAWADAFADQGCMSEPHAPHA